MPETPKPPQIEKFSELLEPHLNGGKLTSYDSEFFTAPGDNYGSTIFRVIAQVLRPDGTSTELNLIAKLLPENELFLQIFEPERSFRTEMSVYTILRPAFIRLQKEAGIPGDEITDVIAKSYGSRISLDESSEKVDSGAALILENLSATGYKMGNRLEGFNYETTLVILRDLARFHALAVAYRVKYPEEFNSKIKPFVRPFNLDKNVPEDMHIQLVEDNLNIIKNLPGMNDEVFEKIMIAFSLFEEHMKKLEPSPDTLFSAIAHNDFWTNNILIGFDDQQKPKDIKIVDFQASTYDSLTNDVIFFLILSVQFDIVKKRFDELLKEYYNQFVKWLCRLGCATEEYSYEKFEKELHHKSAFELQHIVLMHKVLSLRKDKLPASQKMDGGHLLHIEYMHENFLDKLSDIIEIFDKKGWLDIRFHDEIQKLAIYQFSHMVVMHKVISMRKDKLPSRNEMDISTLSVKECLADNFYDKLKGIIDLYNEKGYFVYNK